jgi:hypothetical protein
MAKEIHFIINDATRIFIKNPYNKDREEYPNWQFAKKSLIEECRDRKVKLKTNISDELLDELKKELNIIDLERE